MVDGIIVSITAKECLAIMPQQPPLQEPQLPQR